MAVASLHTLWKVLHVTTVCVLCIDATVIELGLHDITVPLQVLTEVEEEAEVVVEGVDLVGVVEDGEALVGVVVDEEDLVDVVDLVAEAEEEEEVREVA